MYLLPARVDGPPQKSGMLCDLDVLTFLCRSSKGANQTKLVICK